MSEPPRMAREGLQRGEGVEVTLGAGGQEWAMSMSRRIQESDHQAGLELWGCRGVIHSGFCVEGEHNLMFSQPHPWLILPSLKTGDPLLPARSSSCPLLRKLNIILTVKKRCSQEFHPLLQSRCGRVHLKLRGNKLASGRYEWEAVYN